MGELALAHQRKGCLKNMAVHELIVTWVDVFRWNAEPLLLEQPEMCKVP